MQNGLIQVPDTASLSDVFTVHILPALPSNWPQGSIRGARLRGGLTVDFAWSNKGALTSLVVSAGANASSRKMRLVHRGQELKSFVAQPGMRVQIV